MSSRILIFVFAFFYAISISAADIRVVASAPSVVAVGEQLRLEYEVNTQSIKSIQNISKIDGFEILYGPSKSSSYSMQIINGHQTSNSTTTFGYTLTATKEGTFSMPKFTVNVNGQLYSSNSVQVKVVAGGGNNVPSSSQGNRQVDESESMPTKSRTGISNKDLFITVSANKTNVYEQEPILLTYKVFTRVNLTQLGGKMPDLKGFMVKEIPLPQQKSFSLDEYNGERYHATVWSQYVMFPQQTGKLTIPNVKFEGVAVFENPDLDPIDAFFNGGSASIQQKKTIIAPSVDINVLPLSDKPEDFSGAVGDFSIKSVLKTPYPKENETLQLQVTISGVGNVDLIKSPTVNFPSEFETYEPKQQANSQLTTKGMTGSMVIDYVAVPKQKGKFTIPSINFVYFDTSTSSYKTISTEPIEIDIAKGKKNAYSDKKQEILAESDIRYIYTHSVKLHQKDEMFWNKPLYWLLYLGIALLFLMVYLYLNKKIQNQNDLNGRRIRGASKASMARLKTARTLMKQNNPDLFFDEIHNALFSYVANKLNIPIGELTKEHVLENFALYNVPKETSESYLELLKECELFRFSQNKEEQSKGLESIYKRASHVITALDSYLKKKIK